MEVQFRGLLGGLNHKSTVSKLVMENAKLEGGTMMIPGAPIVADTKLMVKMKTI